jgi:hypothetical protein
MKIVAAAKGKDSANQPVKAIKEAEIFLVP